ncbi:5-hydroxytryptamine receptor 1B-like [Diadema antillarum]|uniref:5-hydroxytryptamine receptor 1B-like n=1 Tax=Diadema antillarum TaxID=105358 RepID=UPI003A84C8A6
MVAYLDTMMSVLLVILLCIQRRLAISKSPKYRALLTHRKIIVVLATMWSFFFVFYTGIAFVWPEITNSHLVDYKVDCLMEFRHSFGFSVFMLLVEIAVPFIVLIALCFNIGLEIYARSRRIEELSLDLPRGSSEARSRRVEAQTDTTREFSQEPPPGSSGDTTLDDMTRPKENSLTCRDTSRAESGQSPAPNPVLRAGGKRNKLVGYRKAYLSLLVLVTFYLVCWMPYAVFAIREQSSQSPSSIQMFITVMILYSNSLVNPVLYAITNVHYRRGFFKLLHLPRRWL